MSAPGWRLRLGASPRLCPASGEAAAVALSRKDAALLAHIALAAGVPSARIAGWLWPSAEGHKALNSLRQRVHRLRHATGARLLDVADTAALASDLSFAGPGDIDAGDLLAGFDYADLPDFADWLDAERPRWATARREALAEAASVAERQGELARALVFAQGLLAEDALSEHAHRRVMRLHYLRGDAASAVAAFEVCECALKDQLGLKPCAETLALLRTVEGALAPAATSATQPPSSTALSAPLPSPLPMPMPVTLLRPPRAVGREREQAQLAQAHAQGHIAVVVGEAGMGKTRLLQDFTAGLPQAVYAQARPGDAAVPYGALARLLRAVAALQPAAQVQGPRHALASVTPELAGSDTRPPAPHGLRAAVEGLLAAGMAQGSHTVTFDDLHFADRASIELLRELVDADALAGMRWLFAHRPVAAADEDGALLLALADAPQARWVTLAPLTDGDLAEFVDTLRLPGIDAAALVPALARHTGGNPLYVLETLREAHARPGLADGSRDLPRPRSIAHMIDRRLQRLSEPALALGRVAALAGPDFSAALAEHALATPALRLASAWAELEAADILRGCAFAHDLVRDGMLRATPAPIAAHAHRLIAQHLAERSAEPVRLAQHWLAGGEPGRAAAAFLDASNRAKAAGRPREQAKLLNCRADALQNAGDAAGAFEARIEAINPLLQSEGGAAALAVTDELLADEHLANTREPSLQGRVWSARALALMWVGRIADAMPAAERALALARPDDDSTRVNAACMLAIARSMGGDPAGGVALLEPWAASVDGMADREVQAGFYGNYTNLLMQADLPAQALPAAHRHLQLTRQLVLPGEQVTALMNLSNLHGRRGNLPLAIEHARQADLLLAEAGQSDALQSWNRTTLGQWLAGCGQYAEALALLEAAIAVFERHSGSEGRLALAQDCCARLWLTLGQPARAHRLTAGQAEQPAGRLRARQLLVQQLVARALGSPPAGEALAAVQGMVAESDPVRLEMEIDAVAHAGAQREASAAVKLHALQRRAEAHHHLPLAARAAALRAAALAGLGEHADAAVLLPQAERSAHLHGAPNVYLPEVLLHCAAGWRACGAAHRADEARCTDAALHWIHAVALPHVPPAFVDSFLHRNGVNAAWRSAVARQARG